MAFVLHFPAFLSLSSHTPSLPSLRLPHHRHISHHRLRLRRLPAVCASVKKARANSRKVKSDVDLCNDIKDFLSEVGLPEGHVPSFKELLQHGRQDLANIVRRRGYKFIRELLAASVNTNINVADKEESSTGKQDEANAKKDELTDDCLDMVNESTAEDDERYSNSQIPKQLESKTFSEEQSHQVLYRTRTPRVLDGSSASSSQSVALSTLETNTSRENDSSNGQLGSADIDNAVDVEIRTKENQVEVDRIKFMLHQKEIELSHLKQQIEKEKLALSELQTKAETEISKAQKLVSDKYVELHAAEESLSGLKEVEIEYWSNGEAVEVAGSFNGWHHCLKMDPQPSSKFTDPSGSRKSRLWRSVLWLYPGIYEIKFVVDGKWTIDPTKESITSGTIQNNILRVDR